MATVEVDEKDASAELELVDGAGGTRASWALALSGAPVRRLLGAVLVVASIGYVGWLVAGLNLAAWWLSVPFVAANGYLVVLLLVSLVNNWSRSPLRPAAPPPPTGPAPLVAVLIPTANEPPAMVERTLRSVLEQRWPHESLVVVVGDDGHRPAIAAMVGELGREYREVALSYVRPPDQTDPRRRGRAKDGNLNAMLALVRDRYPGVEFVETRDADDLVGNPGFLRHTVGLLRAEPDVAYVQTIKDATVSRGDPFGNRRTFFYRGIMLSRDAAGAAFPCGSGLVWRMSALLDIGGFPSWNIVEDLYSGYLALQRGYRGRYLPVLGALAQSAPEDLPNMSQQLGTWALDTMRIFLWRPPWRVPGLRLRQRLHFAEMGLFYLSAVPTLALIMVPALCLLTGTHALRVDPVRHAVVSVCYTTLVTAFTFVLGNGTPWREMTRAKQIWVGMTFTYALAVVRALVGGPHRKPAYRITRKNRQPGLYLGRVAPHLAALALLLCSLAYHLARRPTLSTVDYGSMFWVLFYSLVLLGFVRRSWYGLTTRGRPADVRNP
ncbi:glycosyltransferase [Actinocatenispora rupis]|uniref:Glycosyltransferase, catalytic subunit of cellulose synthase and poly-beta-1,6-N-acetylglucosamine synthase n=1 Tax=Actinocatenispora rupis TaxID=519421 RepID=A0A8J3J579_9ACTN|nr:glycosyltransferase [Actinocatenispora rupis]GID16031.1 hypothetical protein Aru02nite_69200 [Actinocatenispora rupis]